MEAIKGEFVFRVKKIEKFQLPKKDVNLKELRVNWGKGSYPFFKHGTLNVVYPDRFRSRLHFKRYRGQNLL
jgi:hypothetical protein